MSNHKSTVITLGIMHLCLFVMSMAPANAIIQNIPAPSIAIGSAGDDVLLFSEGSSYCTSVVVGPKVIVTSAQCIDKTQLSHVAIVFVRNGSRSLSLHCDIGKGAEIALCNTDKPIPVSRIAKIAIGPVSDRVMTVLGYGCRDALLRNFDGVLSAATISITGRIDRLMNLLGVEACPGDAGGGIFGSAPSSRLYGIVIGNLDGRLVAASLLTRDFRGWASQWADRNSVTICGISPADNGCSAGALVGPPQPEEENLQLRPTAILATAEVSTQTLSRAQSGNERSDREVRYDRGETLSDVILLTCLGDTGQADREYMVRALAYVKKANPSFNLDTKFDEPGTIRIPKCPAAKAKLQTTEVDIGQNNSKSLWTYYYRLTKTGQLKGFPFDRPANDSSSPSGLSSPYYTEVFKALNPGQNPSGLSQTRITLPLQRSTQMGATYPVEATIVYAPLMDIDHKCPDFPSGSEHPYDIDKLSEVLSIDADTVTEVQPVRIVMLDGGIFSAGRSSTFRREMFVANGLPNADNLFKAMSPRLADLALASHGTWVASAALGGAHFARIEAGLRWRNIKLNPINVLATAPNGETVLPADRIQKALAEVSRGAFGGITIVNLSIRTGDAIEPLRELLLAKSNQLLFTVAAGNGSAGEGQLLNNMEGDRFPAVYGGRDQVGQANLITVAALFRDHNGTWNRAPFSDFSSNFVELGAPGCRIPVLTYDPESEVWAEKEVTGTSFAAPLVAFAAGVVAAVAPGTTAPEVKQRLIASSDLNPGLITEITDGRALNIPRAAAVYDDAITTKEQLLFGSITFANVRDGSAIQLNQVLPCTCIWNGNDVSGIPLKNVLKVVPDFNIYTTKTSREIYPDKVYAIMGTGSEVDSLDCKIQKEKIAVFLLQHGALFWKPFIEWGSIKDITLRMPLTRTQ